MEYHQGSYLRSDYKLQPKDQNRNDSLSQVNVLFSMIGMVELFGWRASEEGAIWELWKFWLCNLRTESDVTTTAAIFAVLQALHEVASQLVVYYSYLLRHGKCIRFDFGYFWDYCFAQRKPEVTATTSYLSLHAHYEIASHLAWLFTTPTWPIWTPLQVQIRC